MFRILIVFVYFFSSTLAQAQIVNPMGKERYGAGNEYFVGAELGKPLITVNVINGVSNPGVYHIPIGTNMAELFSYSGGALTSSDLELVTVRSGLTNKTSATKVYDFESMLAKSDSLPILSDRDIVHIEQTQGLDTTIKWMSIISMAASILSAVVIVSDRND